MYGNIQWIKLYGQMVKVNQMQMIHMNIRITEFECFNVKLSQQKYETWHYGNAWIGTGGFYIYERK